MKHEHHIKIVGIWLDQKEALMVTTEDHNNYGEFALRKTIHAKQHITSGNEHTMQNSDRGDHLKYLKDIAKGLTEFDEILLIGPGKSQEELRNMLSDDSHFNNKIIKVETADKLTENQLVARVKTYFQPKMHNH
jgi:stalled ribosome rescue protein Dom34